MLTGRASPYTSPGATTSTSAQPCGAPSRTRPTAVANPPAPDPRTRTSRCTAAAGPAVQRSVTTTVQPGATSTSAVPRSPSPSGSRAAYGTATVRGASAPGRVWSTWTGAGLDQLPAGVVTATPAPPGTGRAATACGPGASGGTGQPLIPEEARLGTMNRWNTTNITTTGTVSRTTPAIWTVGRV